MSLAAAATALVYVVTADSGSSSAGRPADVVIEVTPGPEDEAAHDAINADAEQPKFVGTIGDFAVVPRDSEDTNYPCPEPYTDGSAEDLAASELNFQHADAFTMEASKCGDVVRGVTTQVRVARPDGGEGSVLAGFFYFVGESPALLLDVPAERLVEDQMDGLSAVVEQPVTAHLPFCRVFVIVRESSASSPGIAAEVTGGVDCETAKAVMQTVLQGR